MSIENRLTRISIQQGSKKDLGHCNSCSIEHNWKYQKVYNITIGQISVRVCAFCLVILIAEIKMLK